MEPHLRYQEYPVSTNNSKKSILRKALLQESLVDKKTTLPIIDTIDENANLDDIYFGTGISNPLELTTGIPFDFLVYPLLANKLRNRLGSGHIHHLIADNHALINKFDQRTIRKVATDYRTVVENVIDRMGILNYHTYLSSEVSTDRNYKNLLQRISSTRLNSEYARFEAADIQYFLETRDTLIKLGWKFSGESKFDELRFDAEYKEVFGNQLMSIYTASGKKFSDKGPNAVPYTLSKSDEHIRFIIDKNEDIVKKVASQTCSVQTVNALKNHYTAIVRLFEASIHRIPTSAKTVWEKLQHINTFLTL